MPAAIRQFLLFFATLLAQIAMAQAANIPLVLDIHDDHIEAELILPAPAPEKAPDESARANLALYLQTHLSFTSTDGQPMTFELLGLEQAATKTRATLFIYPPGDITPPAFTISTNAVNQRLQILLRRDPAEMRLGTEPPLLLGNLDSIKNSLTIEREFPPLTTRATAAFTTSLQLFLTSATPFLILLLLATTLTQPTTTASAFALAGLTILAFASGTSVALNFETHLTPALVTSLIIAAVAALSLLIWIPNGTTPRITTAIATGWITGVMWNNTWFPQGTLEKETLLTLSAATLPALIAITLLALPALLLLARQLLARQLPPAIFRAAVTLCGIIVILLQLTAFARPA